MLGGPVPMVPDLVHKIPRTPGPISYCRSAIMVRPGNKLSATLCWLSKPITDRSSGIRRPPSVTQSIA